MLGRSWHGTRIKRGAGYLPAEVPQRALEVQARGPYKVVAHWAPAENLSVPLLDILAADRVDVLSASVTSKQAVLERVATLLARGQSTSSRETILASLLAREALQSTGVGAGVAVPHATMTTLDHQIAALVVSSHPVEFDSIDGQPVHILFALIGPKGESAQHLKTLAQVSRVLRPEAFRQQLLRTAAPEEVFNLLRERARAS